LLYKILNMKTVKVIDRTNKSKRIKSNSAGKY
jgi:hypothetical protein